ncbi:unnamed protein product [Polarella glacialis]|uniref:C2H2-type domain-containing protein n=1 Tax=Polarella glacialis TaxID=89957 RepID=A0A813LRF2_POLGL|nr:unnamed protein product [Polarella glacialis]
MTQKRQRPHQQQQHTQQKQDEPPQNMLRSATEAFPQVSASTLPKEPVPKPPSLASGSPSRLVASLRKFARQRSLWKDAASKGLEDYARSGLFELSVPALGMESEKDSEEGGGFAGGKSGGGVRAAAVRAFGCRGEHQAMQQDVARMSAFLGAISPSLVGGKLVMDLGSGPDALLALAAARGGARRVLAVEGGASAAVEAQQAVLECEQRGEIQRGVVRVLNKVSCELQPSDVGEPVEVLLHELLGFFASSEGVLPAVSDVLPLLSSSCSSVPSRAQTVIAPGLAPPVALFRSPQALRMRQRVGPQQKYLLMSLGTALPSELLLAEPIPWEDIRFDFQAWPPAGLEEVRECSFELKSQVPPQGFYLWLRFQATPGGAWTDCAEVPTSWPVLYLPLPSRARVPGPRFAVRCWADHSEPLNPCYHVVSRDLGFQVSLSISELYPLIGADVCTRCGRLPGSVNEANLFWTECLSCRRPFHTSCLGLPHRRRHVRTGVSDSACAACNRWRGGSRRMNACRVVSPVTFHCGSPSGHGPSGVFAAAPLGEGTTIEICPALRMSACRCPAILRKFAFSDISEDGQPEAEFDSALLLLPLGWGLLYRDVDSTRPVANLAWELVHDESRGWPMLRFWARRNIEVWEELVVARAEPGDDLPGPNLSQAESSSLAEAPSSGLLPQAVAAACAGRPVSFTSHPLAEQVISQPPALMRHPSQKLRLAPRWRHGRWEMRVFALQAFSAGDDVDISPVVPLVQKQVSDTSLEKYTFRCPSFPGLSMFALGWGGAFRHSDRPTAELEFEAQGSSETLSICEDPGLWRLVCRALPDGIRAGQEILIRSSSPWPQGLHSLSQRVEETQNCFAVLARESGARSAPPITDHMLRVHVPGSFPSQQLASIC